jgi:hypothetical protein
LAGREFRKETLDVDAEVRQLGHIALEELAGNTHLVGLLDDPANVHKRAEAELPIIVSLFVRAISASEPGKS